MAEDKEVDLVTRAANLAESMLQRAVRDMVMDICEQCGKCTSICPVTRYMGGFNPRKIIGRVSLGRFEDLYDSYDIWTCTSCLKCRELCPENISPYDVIIILRNLAVRRGHKHPSSYREFVDKVVETGLALDINDVRNGTKAWMNRKSLGLPSIDRPQDLKSFTDVITSIYRGRVSI